MNASNPQCHVSWRDLLYRYIHSTTTPGYYYPLITKIFLTLLCISVVVVVVAVTIGVTWCNKNDKQRLNN